MNKDGAPHAGRLPLAEVRRRRAELEASMPEKNKLPPDRYTDIPILTPGDSEMLVVFSDGHVASMAYNQDGTRSVVAGLKQLEQSHTEGRLSGPRHHLVRHHVNSHGEAVLIICNEAVREDYKSHITG